MNANDMKQREKGFCGLLRRAGIACIGISMTLTAMGQQVEQALKQFDTAPTAAAANLFLSPWTRRNSDAVIKACGLRSISDFQLLTLERRKSVIQEVMRLLDVRPRQLSRVTGMNYETIRNIAKKVP